MNISKESLTKRGLTLIPVSEIEINYDPEETVGYDLTVDDYYTFATQDGIFIQDCMAVYIPITKESEQETREKLLVTKNLNSPTNGSLTTIPSQDVILGIFSLTADKFSSLQRKVNYKGVEISEGIKIFNECLPDDYPLINEAITKKKLLNLLNDIVSKYDENTTMLTLDNVKKEGFKYATLYGTTMSLDGFTFEESQEIRDKLYDSTDVRSQLDAISNAETNQILKDNFAYSYMIESGARGTWDQAKQIILTRGFVSNFSGEILETPIKHSLPEGLNREEFFNSTYGCRKGLLDVALNTGSSGYLSRKMIFACVNLQMDPDLDDCGTTDYLEVYINNKQKAKMLVGRYFLENDKLLQIPNDNYQGFVGKTIKLRSPIFCKSSRVCCKCYGDLYKILDSRFIGVIAAQALGERSTQLTLRTFHTSGLAVTKGNSEKDSEGKMKQMDIISDLASASNFLHQFKGRNYKDIVEGLFKIYNRNGNIHHVHFECVVSQLMWYKSSRWRLLKERDKLPPEYHSVQSVPAFESWLLSLAFSNPKKSILRGVINSDSYRGVMDSILRGEEVE